MGQPLYVEGAQFLGNLWHVNDPKIIPPIKNNVTGGAWDATGKTWRRTFLEICNRFHCVNERSVMGCISQMAATASAIYIILLFKINNLVGGLALRSTSGSTQGVLLLRTWLGPIAAERLSPSERPAETTDTVPPPSEKPHRLCRPHPEATRSLARMVPRRHRYTIPDKPSALCRVRHWCHGAGPTPFM